MWNSNIYLSPCYTHAHKLWSNLPYNKIKIKYFNCKTQLILIIINISQSLSYSAPSLHFFVMK